MKTLYKFKYTLILLLLFVFVSNKQGVAQGGHFINGGLPSLKAYEKAAHKAFKEKKYYSALRFYESAVKLDPSKVENHYQFAESARLFGANSLARDAYLKVVELDTDGHYPKARLYRTVTEKNLGNYETANNLLSEMPAFPSIPEYEVLVNREKEDLDYIIGTRDGLAEGEMEVLCLDSTINTRFSEVSPFWRDGELYYASLRFEKINDDEFPPRRIAKTLHSDLLNDGQLWEDLNIPDKTTAHFSFSRNDDRMYFTICDYNADNDMECQLYFRDKIGGNWDEPIMLPAPINVPGSASTHPSVGLNEFGEEVLFFASDRPSPDAKGGLDIWYTTILGGNNFGDPINMRINTEENDITPFFHYSSNALYFSSEGHNSFGGYDIYKVNRMNDNSWTSINYLPEPLNSSYNDFNYSLDSDGVVGFLVSNRENCVLLDDLELACNDIFLVNHGYGDDPCKEQPTELIVHVFSADTEQPLDGASVTIRITDMVFAGDSLDENSFHFPDLTGSGLTKVRVSREGYISETVEIDIIECHRNELNVFLPKETNPCLTMSIVQVYDAFTGQKLNGVSVTVKEGADIHSQEKLDGNQFTFRDIISKNKHKIIVSKEGYKSQEMDWVLERCKVTQLCLSMEPDFPEEPACISNLVITVFEKDLKLNITNAVVTIHNGEESIDLTEVNELGQYVLTDNIVERDYTISVIAPGYFKTDTIHSKINCESGELFIELEEDCLPKLMITVVDDETDETIDYAIVTIEEGEERFEMDRPNLEKTYVFRNVFQAPRHKITVIADGYEPFVIECDRLEDCSTLQLRVRLYKGEEPPCMPSLTLKIVDKKTGEPVANATVNLVESEPNKRQEYVPSQATSEGQTTYSNEFLYLVEPSKYYQIFVNHVNYKLVEIATYAYGCSEILIEVELDKKPPSIFPVITCYFENDIPKKVAGAAETYSSASFEDLYQIYHKRNAYYQKRFSARKPSPEKENAIQDVDFFFNYEVMEGYRKLEIFKDTLYDRLQKGESFVLSIRGYASNLAKNDYNKKLGGRRVWSIKNYFTKTYGSQFLPFLQSGHLELRELAIGETDDGVIFDDPNDPQNSVYNPVSARQRKAQIERVDPGGNPNFGARGE